MASEKLVALYQKMADITRAKCGDCEVYCCSPEQCETTEIYAGEKGIRLTHTGHRKLPFLGFDGVCTVSPHLRPLCTVHICEKLLMHDQEFYDEYFNLREKLSELEYEEGEWDEQG